MTGPLAHLGQALNLGAKTCFSALNAKGGITGRPVDLNATEDGCDVQRALANVKEFIAAPSCCAIFNCLETPIIKAMLPWVMELDIPFFYTVYRRPVGQPQKFLQPAQQEPALPATN